MREVNRQCNDMTNTCLVQTPCEVDNDLPRPVVINELKLTNVTWQAETQDIVIGDRNQVSFRFLQSVHRFVQFHIGVFCKKFVLDCTRYLCLAISQTSRVANRKLYSRFEW